jgi:hypothetical protein
MPEKFVEVARAVAPPQTPAHSAAARDNIIKLYNFIDLRAGSFKCWFWL